MAPFLPFEPNPEIAVAVSGGPDSLALALLAARWATRRGGRVIGLTVDHGLRVGSAKEARQVGNWLSSHSIDHHILKLNWPGRAPHTDIQNQARTGRYQCLGDWCRTRGVLHLLVGHHLDDQVETFLLRLGRGSGVDGLSSMSAISERANYRILRPLLEVSKLRLEATLKRADQLWVKDPSNMDPRYSRVKLRTALTTIEDEKLATHRLGRTATAMARTRHALDLNVAAILARGAICDTGGFIRLSRAIISRQPDELALRIMARCLTTVSGQPYAPRLDALARLLEAWQKPATSGGRTLAGCSVTASGPKGATLLIIRELSATAPPIDVTPGQNQTWDHRFEIRPLKNLPANLRMGALGALAPGNSKTARKILRPDLPARAISTLPVLANGNSVYIPRIFRSATNLNGQLSGSVNRAVQQAADNLTITFRPTRPLTEIFPEPEIS